MKTESLMKTSIATEISKNALKHYETYVAHYKSRNLMPMPLNDFLKNYNR